MLHASGNQRMTLSAFLLSSTRVPEFDYRSSLYHFYVFVYIPFARLLRSRALFFRILLRSFKRTSFFSFAFFARVSKGLPFFSFAFFSRVSKGLPFCSPAFQCRCIFSRVFEARVENARRIQMRQFLGRPGAQKCFIL